MPRTNLPSARASHATVGAAAICATLGVELMFAGFILFGRKTPSAEIVASLTDLGRDWYLPERDPSIYAVGCIAAVVAVILFRTRALLHAAHVHDTPTVLLGLTRGALLLSVASIATFLPIYAFVWMRTNAGALSRPGGAAFFALPLGLILAGAWLAWTTHERASTSHAMTDGEPPRPQIEPGRRTLWPDLLVAAALFLLVYIPRPALIAGTSFVNERFHHWDFYAMAATLGYLHGGSLGTDIYSQYGVGWPLVFAAVSRLTGLGYGMMIHVAVIYGGIYFIGVYLLLRRLVADRIWAIAGVLLVVNAQLFTGVLAIKPHQPLLWQWPSSTVLRSAFDVWMFIALVAHARTGRVRWMAVAGSLVGAAVLFGTDTGIYLAFGLAAYMILAPRCGWTHFAATSMTAGVTLLIGLAIASRGTVFQSGFLRGWLEVFSLYPAGISMQPMFGNNPRAFLGTYLAMSVIGVYLFACALVYMREGRDKRTRSGEELVLLSIAVYGLAYLMQYIARSHPANISHSSVPAMILVVVGAWHARAIFVRPIAWLRDGDPGDRFADDSNVGSQKLPFAILGIAIALLLLNSAFRGYPNLVHELVVRHSTQTIPLTATAADVAVPVEDASLALQYRAVIDSIAACRAEGKTVAVMGNDDTAMYLYGNAPPWHRYSPLVGCLLTKAQLAEAIAELEARRPDYIFLPDMPAARALMHEATTDDVQRAVRLTVERCAYVNEGRVAHFERWRRPD